MVRRSVLDDLGEEVTGIVAPVSLCMALTVALVRILNPDGDSDSNAVFLASAYYVEEEGDSTGQKLSGSIINALIFVGVVAVMTFILVLLFKYGYVKLIYAYMGLAGFSIFFVLTGIIALELLQQWHVHTDFISFTYILFNFAVVGAVTLFFFPAPLLMKQCYLIITGIVTAYVFTWIPEWTTWTLLVAMAIYDVLAVLVPGGPLKMLVELAHEREETIPALVYEARPTRRDTPQLSRMTPVPAAGMPVAAGPAAGGQQGDNAEAAAAAAHALQQQELPARLPALGLQAQEQLAGAAAAAAVRELANAPSLHRSSVTSTMTGSSVLDAADTAELPLIPQQQQQQQTGAAAASAGRPRSAPGRASSSAEDASGDVFAAGAAEWVQQSRHSAPAAADQMLSPPGPSGGTNIQQRQQQAQGRQQGREGQGAGGGASRSGGGGHAGADVDEDDMAFSLPDSIKLGLGDFIFYSVLVGRAAMYDFLTVFACYLAIIAGLGCTLLWLAMARKALPALPISITLAVAFYFISRFVMEPVILPMTLQLVYF